MSDAADADPAGAHAGAGARATSKMEIADRPAVDPGDGRPRSARRASASRPRAVLDALAMARAGDTVGRVREGERVFDLVLRLGGERDRRPGRPGAPADRDARAASSSRSRSWPTWPKSGRVVQIGREQMRRRLIVQANVRGRDMVGFVSEAQARVNKLDAARGASSSSGAGSSRTSTAPRTAWRCSCPWRSRVIAVMLVMTFRNAALRARRGPEPALRDRGRRRGARPARAALQHPGGRRLHRALRRVGHERRRHGHPPRRAAGVAAARRPHRARAPADSLRAIMSTALVAAIGFVPAAIATGTGAEVQRPLATVVIGGLVVAMLLSLPALPRCCSSSPAGAASAVAEPSRARPARARA